jgi:hypothetical protein
LTRDELSELHYISPIVNVASILKHGILSHNKAEKLNHTSVAMAEIQDLREKVVVPNGMPLHDYVNLYICARNPMMFKRKGQHADLCVLRVSTDVLDLPTVVVTDGNAASTSRGYAKFAAAPDGLSIVDRDLTFARYWTDPDLFARYRKTCAKCAEVLVPGAVPPKYVTGAYVSCKENLDAWPSLGFPIAATLNSDMFFR